MNRKKIFEIIKKSDGSNVWSRIYDIFMFVTIIVSVVPLMFWDDYPIFKWIEIFTTEASSRQVISMSCAK